MLRKAILVLSAFAGLGSVANAQTQHRCGTDEMHQEFIKANPQVKITQDALDKFLRGEFYKTTSTADYLAGFEAMYNAEIANTYYIPVVVHVVHDWGTEYVPDNDIYKMIEMINTDFQAKNADIVNVIPTFKKYIGKANIELRLARKDPNGKPTKGITRHRSYQTAGGDEQAKFDQWAPDRYLNIWVINKIGRGIANGVVAAYATLPAGAAGNPYGDGVIANHANITGEDHTITHEVGHYLNLYHVWGNGQVEALTNCEGSNDDVDDTPPTRGHFPACPLYDTACSWGYKKDYTYAPSGGGPIETVTVDYPDTNNTQNIMDYSSCTNMFTQQQVLRMRFTLKNAVANRSNLVSDLTKEATGIMTAANDLPPVPDYSAEFASAGGDRTYYMCADGNKEFLFRNRSWGDTITGVNWEIGNAANPAQSGEQSILKVKVSEPGWIKVKLTATGNNSGSATIEKSIAYAADVNNKINPANGYYQEFAAGSDVDKWPTFNYYDNFTKWQTCNSGYYDNTGIQYTGYDGRVWPSTATGNLKGDFDDFFTPVFDLSGMVSGNCNLNFMSSGAYRTSNPALMNDALLIAYSIDCGSTWKKMDSLTKSKLANKGTYGNQYAPLWTGDWALQSFNIPEVARTSNVMFRFRYRPSVDTFGIGIANGNNFYMDRINVSSFPLGVNTIMKGDQTIALAPNPTNGNAFVVINSKSNSNVNVIVTDMTGKVVYRTQEQVTATINRIEIPESAISVKGMYMVQIVTGNETHTEKLVTY